jgi:hypothetical protein
VLGLKVLYITMTVDHDAASGRAEIADWESLPGWQQAAILVAGPMLDHVHRGLVIGGTDVETLERLTPELRAPINRMVFDLLNSRGTLAAVELLGAALLEHGTVRFEPREE